MILPLNQQAEEYFLAASVIHGRNTACDWQLAVRTLRGLAKDAAPQIARRATSLLNDYQKTFIKSVDSTPSDMEPVA